MIYLVLSLSNTKYLIEEVFGLKLNLDNNNRQICGAYNIEVFGLSNVIAIETGRLYGINIIESRPDEYVYPKAEYKHDYWNQGRKW